MAKLQITVCDECKDIARATTHYRISTDGKNASVDLCNEHGSWLEKWLDRGATRGSRTPGMAAVTVSSLEEIEKIKAARKR